MDLPLLIDGVLCETEKDVRDYAFNYTKQGFKQDFRLASNAYKVPLIQLIEILNATGHTVQQASI